MFYIAVFPFIVDLPLVIRLQDDTLHGRICSHPSDYSNAQNFKRNASICRITDARYACMCPYVCLSFFFFFFFLGGGGCFLAFLCQQNGFVFSVCGCVHIYINKFVLVQALIIACAHWSSLTSVCVSVHNAWALNPLGHKFDYFNHINQEIRTKCVLNWNICYQVTVSDSSVAEGRLSVHVHTKHNIH